MIHLCFICVLVLATSCGTSINVVVRALDKQDRDLSGIKHNLTIFTVNMQSTTNVDYYRLDDVWAINTATQERFRFPLFDNFILRSKDVPHSISGSRLQQTIFLDLPAGTYAIDTLDIVSLEDFLDPSIDDRIVHSPYPKPIIEVASGGPSYFGQMDITVVGVQKLGSHFQANLRLILRDAKQAELSKIQRQYPALEGKQLRIGKMRFEN